MTIAVEVAYSPAPRCVERRQLTLPDGSTVGDALAACGLAASATDLGVWGRRVTRSQRLRHGDRVEVYRALVVDPKEARRLRYKGQRAAKAKRPAGAGR